MTAMKQNVADGFAEVLSVPEELAPKTIDQMQRSASGVVDSGYHYSSELIALMVRRLAASLQQFGVRSGVSVGVALPNCWQWFIVNGAIRMLDAVHVALNWRMTSGELAFAAGDSSCRVVIAFDIDDETVDALRTAAVATLISADPSEQVPEVQSLGELISNPRRHDRDPLPPLGQTSTVVYTSGTTGRPKGAYRPSSVAETREYAEYSRETQYQHVLGVRPRRRVLLSMPFHHSSGLKQGAGVLNGSDLGIVQRRFDAEEALSFIDEFAITDWSTVPTMLQRVLGLDEEVRMRYDHSSLEKVTVGAAPVTSELTNRFDRWFGNGLLFKNYGCTEAGGMAGLTPEERARNPEATGRPFTHVDIAIKDSDGNKVAIGEVGEIWARTPQVISGYMGMGELGPEDLDEEGHFRTGDLGTLDEDGFLTVTGRAKDLIISGGTNIYPVEVEAVLQKCPGVADAAVVGVPDDELGEISCAYLEPTPASSIDIKVIDAHARTELAGYKIPRSYIVVDALPRNHMGKVLKSSLPHSLGESDRSAPASAQGGQR